MQFSPQGVNTFWNDMINGNMYCYNQWFYGTRVINNITPNQTFTISISDPRNIFFTDSSATNTFTLNLSGGAFFLYRSTDGPASITNNVTTLPTGFTVFEFIYISQLNRWLISSY